MAKCDCLDSRKVAVIGCGFVGAATAFALMQSGLFSEMVLIDVDHGKAQGEALDISHGIPVASPMQVYAGDYKDVKDAAIIIITAGVNQKPGETRLDLVHNNVNIMKKVISNILKYNKNAILLIVSNPVDILTYAALKISGLPENQVIGSGTVLDTSRLKIELGEELGVDSRSVQAFILGEHGDSEFAAFSSAMVAGIPLEEFCRMRGKADLDLHKISERVKHIAYDIIEKKQATYYGIAMSVKRICEAIVRDEKSILPISTMMHGEYGLSDVVLSMPAIVGESGVEQVLPLHLNGEEVKKLQETVTVLRSVQEKELAFLSE